MVGANGDVWTVFYTCIGMERMVVFDTMQCAIRIALQMSGAKAGAQKLYRVMKVLIFNDSQSAIGWTIHLDPAPGQQLARVIINNA